MDGFNNDVHTFMEPGNVEAAWFMKLYNLHMTSVLELPNLF